MQSARLLVVGPTPPPAHGVSVMTAELLSALREIDALADHVDTRDPRPIETIGRLDLENVRLGLLHLSRFALLLRKHRDACVYVPVSQGTWGFVRDACFLLLARWTGHPRYVHLHGGQFGEFYRVSGAVMKLIIRESLRGTHQAWVLTAGLSDEFKGLIPRQRVRVLENCSPELAAVGRDLGQIRTGGDPLRFKVLYLSNLIPEKGCVDLVEALTRIGPDAANLHIRFVGDASASLLHQLETKAAEIRGWGARIDFDGVLTGTERTAAYQWAEVFVLPTRYPAEGQPIVLLEAMSMGLPIISTRHRGIPETVRDGAEAVLIEPGDTEALKSAIVRLRDDPRLRGQLSRAARARYEARYTPARFRHELRALLQPRQDQREAHSQQATHLLRNTGAKL